MFDFTIQGRNLTRQYTRDEADRQATYAIAFVLLIACVIGAVAVASQVERVWEIMREMPQ